MALDLTADFEQIMINVTAIVDCFAGFSSNNDFQSVHQNVFSALMFQPPICFIVNISRSSMEMAL